MPLHAVILAAGKGTRMKSVRPKVLHPLSGRLLVEHVLDTVATLQPTSTVLVIGHGADEVKTALASRPGLQFVVQSPQLGTGHALLQTEGALAGQKGTVLLLYADVPLLAPNTLARLIEAHRSTGASATVLTTMLDDPYGYGRIVRDAAGKIVRIVEERDASGDDRAIKEVNTGIYVFALAPLFSALRDLASDNSQEEYYLTDLVAAYRRQNLRVETVCLDAGDELRGVNSRVDLADLTRLMRDRKNRALMLDGVTLEDPATTYVDDSVTVGADTTIGANVHLQGRTTIGGHCHIHPGVRLTNATVADHTKILDYCVITDATIGVGASVGPFAHVRPDSVVGEQARVGNFVELKKTHLGRGAKANHLAYLGDATIGADANIGAGTITCNYDGMHKNPTIIEDGVFIGSDTQLIAPVRIGKGAYVAAGSTITFDVPADALAISRGRQENKPGWAAAKRALNATKKD